MAINITGYFDDEGAETGFSTQATTDDTSPLLQGTVDPLNPGDSIYVIRDGMLLAKVNDVNTTNWTWSFQDNGLVDGHTYSYTMWVLNSAGLPTAISSAYAIKISTGPPPTPPLTLEVWDDKGTMTGQVANNGMTDDDTPTLRGVLSAALVAGQFVHVFRNDQDLGTASVNGTNWEYTDGGLTIGNNYTYMAKIVDEAGDTVAESNARAITLANPPAAQTPTIAQVYDDVAPITGVVSNGMSTNDTRPTLSGGGAAPNTTVNVYDNNVKIGTTKADGSGNWTYMPTDTNRLGDGKHSLTVTNVDAWGTESPQSAAVTFTVDTLAPTAVAIISAISENTNGREFITSDKTLVVFASVDKAIASGEKVQISIDNGATWHDAAPVSGSNNSYQYDATGTVFKDGIYAFQARVVGAAGNASAGPRQDVMIDTVAPTTLATIISITEDTGTSATDFYTADNTLLVNTTVNGPLGFYEKAQISLDDGATWKDMTRLVSGSIFTSDSTWQYDATKTPLADGTYTFQARVVDFAGNSGQVTSQTVVIDTTPPAAKVTIDSYTDNVGPEQGNFLSGSTTDDRTPTLNGTLDKVMDAGERVRIYDANTNNAIGYATVDASGKAWTYEITEPLVDASTVRYQAAVVDQAGNVGNLSSVFTMSVELSLFVKGQNTTDTTPMVTGSTAFDIKPGEYMLVTVDNHTYDSRTGEVMVDLRNNTWAVQIPDANALYTQKGGVYYDVNAVLMGADDKPITNDKTTNELFVSPLPQPDALPPATDPQQKATAVTLDENGMWLIHANQTMLTSMAVDSTSLADFYTTKLVSNPGLGAYTTNFVQNATFIDYNRDGLPDLFASDSNYSDGQQMFYNTGTYDQYGNTIWAPYQVGAYQTSPYAPAGTPFAGDSGPSSPASTLGSANTYSWHGGIIAIDKGGTGYDDIVYGDQTPNDGGERGGNSSAIVLNHDGTVFGMDKDVTFANNQYNNATTKNTTGPYSQAQPHQELSGVDLNNDGKVEIVMSSGNEYAYNVPGNGGFNTITVGPNTGYGSTNYNRLVVVQENGTGGWDVTQIINNVFQINSDVDTYSGNMPSMTWADFNGDGFMDLFLDRGCASLTGTAAAGAPTAAGNYESRIYFNDGQGHLASTTPNGVGNATTAGTYFFGDTLSGGASLAVDWNMDGKMDIIELPGMQGSSVNAVATADQAGPINLYINTTKNGLVSFDTANMMAWTAAQGKAASFWTGTTIGTAVANTTANANNRSFDPVTGALAIDLDWDGDKDLIVFTLQGHTQYIENKNIDSTNPASVAAAYGKSLHLKILDAEGINSLFGNTVQLVDESTGQVVSTQIINPQSGNQTNDSSALVDFYNLTPGHTYSAVILRQDNGNPADVGGVAKVGDNTVELVNPAWAGLKPGEANHAYVLTTEGPNNVANASTNGGTNTVGIVGTGYNDTFFATQGNDIYNGGGGTQTISNVTAWTNDGGQDIVDYKLAGNTSITVNLSLTTEQNTGFGRATFINIEGIAGGGGNDVFTDSSADNIFEGRGGNDTFNLTNGGHDTLMYKMLNASDPTGGNGQDQVNGFTVGIYEATPNADRIDLHELLLGYTPTSVDGPAKYINGIPTIDAGDRIVQYLSVSHDGNNTVLNIDMHGAGTFTPLLTLNNAPSNVTLAELLANHQIVLTSDQPAAVGGASAPLLAAGAAPDLSASLAAPSDGNTALPDGNAVSTDAAGNHVITSGSGGDTFNLGDGASDTILYKMIDSADAAGGHGHDQVNNFTLGAWGTTPGADRIDLSELLQGYKPDTDNQTQATTGATTDNEATSDAGNMVDSGKPADTSATSDSGNIVDSGKPANASTAADIGNTVESGNPAEASATADAGNTVDSGNPADNGDIDQYLSVSHDDNSTTVNIDIHGTGDYAPIVTLNGVDVSLETLLANNQIVV